MALKQYNGIQKFALFFLISITIVLFGVLAGLYISNPSDFSTESAPSQQESTKVTLDKFNKIETGMTYEQVVDIIGEEGTLSTESSAGKQTMKIYYWYAENGIFNATISFMNGKVNAKSQIGLDK